MNTIKNERNEIKRRNDRCKDNETREREFWYRVSVRHNCSEKSETLFPVYFTLYFSQNQSKIFSRYVKIHDQYSIYDYTRSVWELKHVFVNWLVLLYHFSSRPFCSLFLTYVQRISHKNAGWSIIRAIHLGDTLGLPIKRFLMRAA